MWKEAVENFPEKQNILDHGWVIEEGDVLPRWCHGAVLPENLADLLEGVTEDESDDIDVTFETDNSDESDAE